MAARFVFVTFVLKKGFQFAALYNTLFLTVHQLLDKKILEVSAVFISTVWCVLHRLCGVLVLLSVLLCGLKASRYRNYEHISHKFLCFPVLSSWLYPSCMTLCNRPAVNQELSNIFNELWRLDANRWTPGVDYTISVQVQSRLFFRLHLNLLFFTDLFCWTLQGRAGFVSHGSHVVQDHASQPLFSNVNENKLSNTTILSSKCLYNRWKYQIYFFWA